MGDYAPDDSRDVTLNANSKGVEPARTGPREGDTRAQEQASQGPEGNAQQGYGNSRDADGKTEKDAAKDKDKDKASGDSKAPESKGDGFVGETAADPAVRARADANRAL